MEDWEGRFKRVNMPDSSVPSHREALRKKLLSNDVPAGHNRRAVVTFSLALLIMLGGLTAAYPGWANDLWKTIFVETITLQLSNGNKVIVKKFPAEDCSVACDTSAGMKMLESGERRMIFVESEIAEVNMTSEAGDTITINTPDCDKIWVINGDTVGIENLSYSMEQITEDPGTFEWNAKHDQVQDEKSPMSFESNSASSTAFELHQNYPNPFNPTTQIAFDLAQSGPATLKVYNLMGQEIATLLNGQTAAGHHTITFDGSNLPSGTYLYILQAAGQQFSKTMVLAK